MDNRTLIFYDVETTGLNRRKNSIIELSGFVDVNGEVVEYFQFFMRPRDTDTPNPEALKVNKWTLEELAKLPGHVEVFQMFLEVLDKYTMLGYGKEKAYLIGFNNASFDEFFIQTLFELCGNNSFPFRFYSGRIDAMILAAQYLIKRRPYMPDFKLKTVAEELGIDVNSKQLHGALYDADLARTIYRIVTGADPEPNWSAYRYRQTPEGELYKYVKGNYTPDPTDRDLVFQTWRQLLGEKKIKNNHELLRDDLL